MFKSKIIALFLLYFCVMTSCYKQNETVFLRMNIEKSEEFTLFDEKGNFLSGEKGFFLVDNDESQVIESKCVSNFSVMLTKDKEASFASSKNYKDEGDINNVKVKILFLASQDSLQFICYLSHIFDKEVQMLIKQRDIPINAKVVIPLQGYKIFLETSTVK